MYLRVSQKVEISYAPKEVIEHIQEDLLRAFYEEVDKEIAKSPAGILLGKPVFQKTEDLLLDQPITTFRIYATCTHLPEPPLYLLIGGPADGQHVKTFGSLTYRYPIFTPTTYSDMFSDSPTFTLHIAVYERQADTSAYIFMRMEKYIDRLRSEP
jgi:hypothetical protein